MATLKRYTGTNFEYIGLPTNVGMSPQTIGYAEITATQSGITSEVALTGSSVNVVVPAGRRIRITAQCFVSSTVANDLVRVKILQDGAQIQSIDRICHTANVDESVTSSTIETPSAGSHTYSLAISRAIGTGNVRNTASAAVPTYILIEDITGSTLPYQPASVPVGVLARDEKTTPFGGITSFSVEFAKVNFVVPAGRLIRISAGGGQFTSTQVNDRVGFSLELDGAVVQVCRLAVDQASQNYTSGDIVTYVSPSAGVHTVTMRGGRAQGTGTVTYTGDATSPIYLSVEDVTPTPAPSDGAPGSTLDYKQVTANQTGITSQVDLTGLSATVTVPAGRRIRISASALFQNTAAGNRTLFAINEGVTPLRTAAFVHGAANVNETFQTDIVLTPSAGTHTYKLVAQAEAGTSALNASADNPAYILVEDITGSLWPQGSEVTAGMIASEPWTNYVPANTNVTLGSGTQVARYMKIGRTVFVTYQLTFAADTMFTGNIQIGLPFPPANQVVAYLGPARFFESGVNNRTGNARQAGAAQAVSLVADSDVGDVNATRPFTWGTGDTLYFSLTYEAAF